MTELLTAAQMRAIEQAAIDSGEVTGLELMERAGQGVVDAIFEEWPELGGEGEVKPSDAQDTGGPAPAPPGYLGQKEGPLRAVVLCGPGNNGGDGFVVARLLHQRGWAVEVFLYGDAEKLPPDARVNYERWLELGGVTSAGELWGDGPFYDLVERRPVLFVDALFGTGLTRPLRLEELGRPESGEDPSEFHASCLNQWLDIPNVDYRFEPLKNGLVLRVVAVDIPSGICSDSGKIIGERAFNVDLTVSFHTAKIGHRLKEANDYCGKLVVCPIGIETENGVWNTQHDRLQRFASPICQEVCAQFAPSGSLAKISNHKFFHGHLLVVSGGTLQTGAARLAARSALRIGAGLVTLGVPPEARKEAASQLTAIMLKQIETAEDLNDVLQDKRINALCLGPAIGLDRAKPLVVAALDAGPEARPTVLDADALSVFADEPEALFELLHDECVLTPHGGEFSRLFPDIAEKLNAVPTKGPAYSKVDATRDAAKRAGCIVLFKGADTVIAAPDGRCSVNSAHYERSAPWLATAGSGDVLAGFITGLLARGFAPLQAAETAAWLHVECALKFGPGLIAEDIPEQLPAVFRDLGL